MYFVIAASRVVFPYDIDFVEDGLLMQALRIARGQAVFLAPNADFVPHVYMPLYTSIGGLMFKFVAPGFVPLRLLSLCATVVSTWMIYLITQRESNRRWLALVSGALYLSGYGIIGGWFELARVDALYVALTLAGVASAIYSNGSTRHLFVCGLLLGLSFLTKQNALLFVFLVTVYLFLTMGRRMWIVPVTFTIVTAIPLGILHLASEGWSSIYFFSIAFANPLELERLVDALRFELFGSMLLLVVGLITASIRSFKHWHWHMLIERPWLLFVAAAAGVSVLGRASLGGNINNWMLGYAFLCLVPALLTSVWKEDTTPLLIRIVSILILIQFALNIYNPLRYIPDEAMYASNERLIARIASLDGEVLVMQHPFYAFQAGKEPSAQIAAMWHARWRGQAALPIDFVARIEDRAYAAIISDESLFETEAVLVALINANYVRHEELGEVGAASPLDGKIPRPVVYLARE